MTTLFKIIDRIRKIQDDDIDQVLQRYPIKTPNYPHTKTFNVFQFFALGTIKQIQIFRKMI